MIIFHRTDFKVSDLFIDFVSIKTTDSYQFNPSLNTFYCLKFRSQSI